jgi:hypothetical protein
VARVAKRGKKAILARKGYRGRKEKEVTPEARVSPVHKVPRDPQGQKEKEATRVHRVSLDLKAREASLVARAYPALKVHKDPQGQRANLADPTRPQQLEDHISDRKGTWLRQGKELQCRPKGWMSPI